MKNFIQNGILKKTVSELNPNKARLFHVVNLKKYFRNKTYGSDSLRRVKENIIGFFLFRLLLPLLLFINVYIAIFAICNLVNAQWVLKLYIVLFSLAAVYELVFLIADYFFRDFCFKASKYVMKSIAVHYQKDKSNTYLYSAARKIASLIARFQCADSDATSLISYLDRLKFYHYIIAALLAIIFYSNPHFIFNWTTNYDFLYHIGFLLVDNLFSGVFGVAGLEPINTYKFSGIDKMLLGFLGIAVCLQTYDLSRSVFQVQQEEFKVVQGSFSTVYAYISLLPKEYQAQGAIGVIDHGWIENPSSPVMWYLEGVKSLAETECNLIISRALEGSSNQRDVQWEDSLPIRLAVQSSNLISENEPFLSIEDIVMSGDELLLLYGNETIELNFYKLKISSSGISLVDMNTHEIRLPFQYLWPFSERLDEIGMLEYRYKLTEKLADGKRVALFELT